MSEMPTVGAFAIVPNNDLPAALPFWERLGFKRSGGGDGYVIMTGWGCEVHLTQAGDEPWRVSAANNPFGVFIRTPDVDAVAALVDDLIIRLGGIPRHRELGLYEFGINGPYGLLVRVGWPSRLMRQARSTSMVCDVTDACLRGRRRFRYRWQSCRTPTNSARNSAGWRREWPRGWPSPSWL